MSSTDARGRAEPRRRPPLPRACTLALLAVLAGAGCTCGVAVRDACDSQTGACTPCADDAECSLTYECCGPSFLCAHRDDPVVLCQLACADPLGPEPDCRCVEGGCRGE